MRTNYAPMEEQIPGRYTIRLNGRDERDPRLTYEEAAAMYMLGFRFSIFDPVNGEFNVSRPYTTIENVDRGTLMFVKE